MSKTRKATTNSEDEPSLTDVVRLLKIQADKLESISLQVNKVDKIEAEVKDLKTLMVSLKEENKELREQVKIKDKVIEDMAKAVSGLEDKLNNVEQHHRGWGARVLNLPISEEDAANPSTMIEKVFDLALRPILEGAMRAGRLEAIPPAKQVLEVAHVLPGKPGQPRPVIMRFYSRNIRSLCFQFKRDFAPREQPTGRGGGQEVNNRGRFIYPIYDDLTKPTLNKMRAIQQDERVQACWTVNGRIHFKLKDSDSVRKVVSILDPLDLILK
jgi:uncharacterized protein YoxC